MTNREVTITWTEADVNERLGQVHKELLSFLKQRTRLDWFKHKVRWRLGRSYVWPGAPDDFEQRLREAVEQDVGVDAFRKHLESIKGAISQAIERYNWALKRWMEQERGRPVNQFDEASRGELRRRRITFEGIRDNLMECARNLTPDSGPELIPEILSMRLAILNEDVRGQTFADVAASTAALRADETAEMSPEEQKALAHEIEVRLHCLDQYHVARQLAGTYEEARRLMGVDLALENFRNEVKVERSSASSPGTDPFRQRRIKLVREILLKKIGYLEEIYARSRGTHHQLLAMLREAPPPESENER